MESLGLQCEILTPDSGDTYTQAIRRFSDLSILKPKYIIYPTKCDDIVPILKYAASQSPPLEVAVKSGGVHTSTWASSAGGIVIDLGKRLNRAGVAEDKSVVYVQGGASWGEVYEACKAANVDVAGGPLAFVGVSGFTLGGGYGPFSGLYGLAIDNIVSARVLLADGRSVQTSATEEPDLFWAIRGGGGQFGIVVEWAYKVYPTVGPFNAGIMIYSGEQFAGLLKAIQDWKVTQTGNEKISMMFTRPGPHFKPSVMVMPWITSRSEVDKVLSPLRDGEVKPLVDKISLVPDMATASHAGDAQLLVTPRRLTIRGTRYTDLYTDMITGVWERWCKFTENDSVKGSTIIWDITNPSKIAEAASDATAAHVRSPHCWFAAQGRSQTEEADDICRDFVASTVTFVRETNAKLSGKDLGLLLNMADGTEKAEDVFGENLPRLRKLKAKYDPNNFWKKGFAIEPDFE